MKHQVPLARLISTGRAARRLGISNQAVWLRCKTGSIPFVLISGRRFFDREVIEKLAKQEAQ